MSVFQFITELMTELSTQEIRLWLEDDQLRFSAPKSGMSAATLEKLKQHKSDIIDFLNHSQNQHSLALTKVDSTQLQPLSYAQERIWFLCQLDPENTAFHLTSIFSISGKLDKIVLQKVLNTIIARHSILRTAYIQTETGIYQKILPEKSIHLFEHNISNPTATPFELQQLAKNAVVKPFDLEAGTVAQCQIFNISDTQFTLIFTLHHIATDGWSMNIIAKEISTLYELFVEQKNDALNELPFQYVDYSVWQRQYNQSSPIQQQLAYWKKELVDIPALQLPCDFPRPAISQNNGSSLRFTLDASITTSLNGIAHNNNATLYMTLLSLFSILLYRYSQQETFCIGTPISGRANSQVETMIGCFLNMIAIKTDHQPSETFLQLLAKNRLNIQQALAHQDIPFEQVVKNIVTERDLSVTPVFQVLFGLQNIPLQEINSISEINIQMLDSTKQTALYDLSLSMNEWQGEIVAELDFKSELFEEVTIHAMIDNFKRLISSVIENPQQKLSEINIVSIADEKKQIEEWNQTAVNRKQTMNDGQPTRIHHFIEQQAIITPNAIALSFNNITINYQSLNQQANQLADYLFSCGVKKDQHVGIYLDRSEMLPIAILAILKCGCAYVPFDLSFPEERLNFIAKDAEITFLLSSSLIQQWQTPATIARINIDQISYQSITTSNPDKNINNNKKSLFNIIYTSGSSGQPKGVMVSHAAMINRLLWMQETFPLNGEDVVLQKTPYGFDVSVWEIFWPLMFGAKLVLANPHGHKNPAYLHDLIIAQKVTTLHFVPSMLGIFLQTENIESCISLRQVFCSGEVLSAKVVKDFFALFPQQTLVNLYGPTEAAIDVSYYQCNINDENIPIGKPISNTQLYLLDSHQKILPVGAVGEIYIGGENLAEGYIHQKQLSESVFIKNPLLGTSLNLTFPLSDTLYKTGDFGRFDRNGNLHFLGRKDEQIKIRGFRIELGEINQRLSSHPMVRESLVTTKNNTRILAYFIANNPQLNSQSNPQLLRDYLIQTLPTYMIPISFIELAEWPLTINGKINYRLLPDPERNNFETRTYVAPRNAIETKIAEVWSELLEMEKVGIHDNFFELGGHSLLATIAIARLQKEFNVTIQLRDIFKDPTIANISRAIDTAKNKLGEIANERLGNDEEEITL